MNDPNNDLKDIFRSTEDPAIANAQMSSEDQLADDIRKHRLINISFGVVAAGLFIGLAALLIHNYRAQPSPDKPAESFTTAYTPAYSLPSEELWARNYKMVARDMAARPIPANSALDIEWVKYTAYNVIMGEQALRNNLLDSAKTYLTVALKISPRLRNVHEILGTICLKQQDFSAAAKHLQLALKEHKTIAVLNNTGLAFMGLGDFSNAESYLKQAVDAGDPSNKCRKNLALLYQQAGRIQESIQQYNRYLTRYPDDSAALQAYTDLLVEENRTDEAIAFLESLTPSDSLPVYLLLARTSAKINDAHKAVAALKNSARFLSPTELMEEIHRDVFQGIQQERVFENLAYQLELASVSLSSDIPALNTNSL